MKKASSIEYCERWSSMILLNQFEKYKRLYNFSKRIWKTPCELCKNKRIYARKYLRRKDSFSIRTSDIKTRSSSILGIIPRTRFGKSAKWMLSKYPISSLGLLLVNIWAIRGHNVCTIPNSYFEFVLHDLLWKFQIVY